MNKVPFPPSLPLAPSRGRPAVGDACPVLSGECRDERLAARRVVVPGRGLDRIAGASVQDKPLSRPVPAVPPAHAADGQPKEIAMSILARLSRRCRLFAGALLFALAAPAFADAGCPPLLDHSFPRLQDEKPQSLCEWKGKVLLVVNTASYCGFTKQYDGLEKLYARLKDRGLVVVGFPTNDFGEQEPGSNKEIADFCRLTYGVQFPMFAKTTIKGEPRNPFYAKLIAASGTTPKWNFYKYLIDRSGKEVVAYSSFADPDDKKMLAKIDEFLARP
jgi:glutathione peroxidase